MTHHIPSAKVLGITDINTANLKSLADELSIEKIYSGFEEMLDDPEIDAVLICSSTDTHADIAVKAAQKGKHIFCEKPVDLTPEKVLKVKEAVEKAGVVFQVGFNRRFDHNFSKIKEFVASGKIGETHIVKITSRDPAPPPAQYSAVSGGMFLDMTIHDFDMARFLTGSEIVEIFVNATCLVDPEIGDAGDVDTAVISLKFANGAIGVIDNSRKAVYGYDQRVEVFGSKGSVVADNDKPTNVTLWSEENISGDKPLYFFLERYMQSFTDEVAAFIKSVEGQSLTPVGIKDGLNSLLVALAAKESLSQGKPIKINY
ncbi:MAG TPA: inositol 2-dehydrogenase [Clostridiales bacterium]|nr:inositol 2-dehydrogenase [Clostridiales bacterium]